MLDLFSPLVVCSVCKNKYYFAPTGKYQGYSITQKPDEAFVLLDQLAHSIHSSSSVTSRMEPVMCTSRDLQQREQEMSSEVPFSVTNFEEY